MRRRLVAVLGVWVVFQSVTGLVLVFGDSIEHWGHPELTSHGHGDRGAAAALAVVRQNFPGEEVGVLATPAVSDGVYVVEVGERSARGSGGVPRRVYVDPAGPRINGSEHHDAGFVALVRALHRRFLFDSLFGLPGTWVVGGLAVAWLGLALRGSIAAAVHRLGHRWGHDPSVLQRLVGVVAVAPIVLVVVTGIRLALPAGTDRIWAAVTGSGEGRADRPPEGVRITSEDRGGAPQGATQILAVLGRRYPDGHVARLLMPPPDDRVAPVIAGLSVGFDPGRGEHDYGGNTVVFLDQYSADTLWAGGPDSMPAARQAALLWSRPLHTGSVAGEQGRLLWAWLAVAVAVLGLLGCLTLQPRTRRARRSRVPAGHTERLLRQRRLRRRKALARRRRVHAARVARAARRRRRTSRHLRRRRKVQARILGRTGPMAPGAGPADVPDVAEPGGDVEIDLTERIEIDLTDGADVGSRSAVADSGSDSDSDFPSRRPPR